MISALLGAIALSPLFWTLVPVRWRKDFLGLLSVVLLGAYDPHLPVVVVGLVAILFVATRIMPRAGSIGAGAIFFGGLASLTLLFAWNKAGPRVETDVALASQSGIALLGMSYFVLKAASILIETHRRTLASPSFLSLARWLLYFPIYTSGPIESFRHFDEQNPLISFDRFFEGIDRILMGCVRAFLLAHYLGVWVSPILAAPEEYSPIVLLAGMFAMSLRIYWDFAGYSDIAIGLAAIYGYRIQENFDRPLLQRNLVDLWQRWHMTLTGWLRIYIFTPATRALMKRAPKRYKEATIAGQVITMAFCGLWHDLTGAFLAWGVLHGLALGWTSVVARDWGRKLPDALVLWWRESRLGWFCSLLLTLTIFSAINILAFTNLTGAERYFTALLRL